MICKKCGFETPSNSNFCAHCGERIDFDDEFINASATVTENVQDKKEQKETKKYFAKENDDTVDMGHASPAWYYLGFFCPIAGFILFYIYAYKKPDLAFRCRRGAVAGILFDIFLALISIIFRNF